jgi:hypothetical protein
MAASNNNNWYFSTGQTVAMYFRFIARITIMVSAIFFLAHLSGYNPTKVIMRYQLLGYLVVALVAVSVLYFAFSRNFYLPFLGWSVYPCGSLAEKVPAGADTTITVQVPPNVNVVYWASEPSDPTVQPIDNPWDAYANYENSGVVRADSNGNAVLRVRSPSSYNVGLTNKTLSRHIHYRVCRHPGMLSDIKTVFM